MTVESLRKHGEPPYSVALVHGGPGAPGEMAPMARELTKKQGVLEPLQTKDSISGQVAELKDILTKEAPPPVILIGWSWGAWLSFILAAQEPDLVKKLVLVSSGPFEQKYARSIIPTRLSRLSGKDRERANQLMGELQTNKTNQNDNLAEFGKLISKADSYNLLPSRDEAIVVNINIYQKVWQEAENLRASGQLLKLAADIKCPVVVIHGDYDPHPYEGVKNPLSRVIKNGQFILLKRCGHHPWNERFAKDQFYQFLREQILEV